MTNIRYTPLREKKLKEVTISLTGVEMAFVWDKDKGRIQKIKMEI